MHSLGLNDEFLPEMVYLTSVAVVCLVVNGGMRRSKQVSNNVPMGRELNNIDLYLIDHEAA